jgi:hypothetical protein
MEHVRGILTAISRLTGYTPASVDESPKWAVIVQNMAHIRGILHQVLKGKQIKRTLYGVYTEVLHNLTAVLKESAIKEETTKTTITAPPSIVEFRE